MDKRFNQPDKGKNTAEKVLSCIKNWKKLISTSMSDATVSDCPSAATCHIATTWNGTLLGVVSSTAVPPMLVSDLWANRKK